MARKCLSESQVPVPVAILIFTSAQIPLGKLRHIVKFVNIDYSVKSNFSN